MRLPCAALALSLALAEVPLSCTGKPSAPAHISTERASFIEALGALRPTQGRLMGFRYARFGFAAASPKKLSAAKRHARRIEQAATAANPESLADAALVRLVSGRIRQAVALLDRAASSAPDQAWILGDLAAARVELFRETGQAIHLVQALSAVEAALRKEAWNPEIAFNRALILELLGLRGQARSAWEEYLLRDGNSDWAADARGHLRSLQEPSGAEAWQAARARLEAGLDEEEPGKRRARVRRYRQFVRLWLQEEQFPAWAKALAAGDLAKAQRIQHLLEVVSGDLSRTSGDPLLRDAARALAAGTDAKRQQLVRAHLRYADGRVAYEASNIGVARPAMVEAQRLFGANGSPFEFWAAFHVAACDYYLRRGTEAVLAQSSGLRQRVRPQRYVVLEARTYWMDGAVFLDQGRPSEALSRFRLAAPLFEASGERNYRAWIASLLANTTRYLGDSTEAWNLHLQALTIGAREGFTLRLPVFLNEASRTAAKDGNYLAGLAFQTEALEHLRSSDDPLDLAEAYWWRSIMHHQAGEDRRAQADIDLAFGYCKRIVEPSVRNHALAGISVTAGAIMRSRDPRAAVESLSRALELYRPTGFRYLECEIRLERARAQLALGRRDAAEADLLAAIDEYERERAGIASRGERVVYFDQARDVFDLATELLVEKGHPDRALEIVERGKTLGLLEAMAGQGAHRSNRGSAGTVTPALQLLEIEQRLPAGASVIEFVVLPEQTRAWVITVAGTSAFKIDISSAALGGQVDALRLAIQRRRGDFDRLANELSSTLLSPLGATLPRTGQVVIVPDRALHGLPFAALRHPGSGRFLGETLELLVAPSARAYLKTLEIAQRLEPTGAPSALAIGNPAIDRELFPHLPPLDDAEFEARRMAATLPGSAVLIGERATFDRFRAHLNHHDVILFAGHALTDPETPDRSRLLFARGTTDEDTGEVTAHEIERLAANRPRLVILSACRAASGRASALEGVTSLAQSFLLGGVPAVMAPLWDVPDQGARAFLATFTDAFGRSGDAAASMVRAREQLIQERRHGPEVWAAFQLIGAGTRAATTKGGSS